MMRIAVFASGYGSNFAAIIKAVRSGRIKAKIALLVCDNPRAMAIKRARRAGIKAVLVEKKDFPQRDRYDAELARHLKQNDIDLIVLAGFMRLLSGKFVRKYRGRIMNIHPSLLPAFKGTQGIKDALRYAVKVTGVTVHFVDEELDHGPIIMQAPVEISDSDTLDSLEAKIHRVEHRIYPEAIRLFAQGKLRLKGRRVTLGAA